jgi:hypothetical protein
MAYLAGVVAGFAAAFAFFAVCFLCAFFTGVEVAGEAFCAFGAANIAAADKRVMLMSFFIFWFSSVVADRSFVRSQSYFAWKSA